MENYKQHMEIYRNAVEEYLNTFFQDDSLTQQTLFRSMRYSLLAGGKRVRPVLVLEFCRICGGDWKKALPFAAAIEMVHTYSLIHDDLPCMDNDDYRRGRLTNHKVFGDAIAVLAGDALLTAAFETIANADIAAEKRLEAVKILSEAAGELGMVGGQVLDMEGETVRLNEEQVNTIHRLKTGCLISAACRLGVAAAGGSAEQMKAAASFAESLGMAFQIRDDMLDVLGDEKKLGKATHMDEQKTTYVDLYGIAACAKLIEQETNKAISALAAFDDAAILTQFANNMAIREV